MYDQRYDHRDRGKIYYDHISHAVMSHIHPKGALLDIGCGTGLFVERYLSNGGQATGIDISFGMIRKAREKHPYSQRFLVGNAEELPFKDASFNSISSLLAFSYLLNPKNTMDDCFRVLVPGGRIALCTLGKNVFTSGLPALYRIGAKMRIRRVGVGSFSEHYYSPSEMYSLLEESGFEDIKIFRYSFAHFNMTGPLYIMAKKAEPFVEEKIPYLAYNLIACGKKPGE